MGAQVRGVLHLGDEAQHPSVPFAGDIDQLEQVAQAQDRVAAVEGRGVLTQLGQPFDRPQRRQFGPGEVLGEPPGDGAAVDDLVVRFPANSGCRATSVVPEISFSCRRTSSPSSVATMSGSTASAPSANASSYDARVCSGR